MIDGYIIDQSDRFFMRMQKKGYLLTEMRFVAGLLFWVSDILFLIRGMSPPWIILSVVIPVGSLAMWSDWKYAQRNKDYPTNPSRVLQLNALVLLYREQGNILRPVIVAIIVAFQFMEYFLAGALWGLPMSLAFLVSQYVRTATYIGPGEFAKNKQEQLTGKLAHDAA
jgi:hypothetical protein